MNQFAPLFLVLRFTFGGPAPADPPDRWIAEDKLKHFFLSFAATNIAFGTATTAGLDRVPAQIVAGVSVAAAGVGKELYDRRHGRPFSEKDLVWDGIGIAAGLGLASQARSDP